MPRVAIPFKGVPDGESQVRQFEVGDEVHGDLARVAEAEGWLESPTATVAGAIADVRALRSAVAAGWRRLIGATKLPTK